MKDKLKIKELEKSQKEPCSHETLHMVDLLAGEISDKDRATLAMQLDTCEVCRANLADLHKAWDLTANTLKAGESAIGNPSSGIGEETQNREKKKISNDNVGAIPNPEKTTDVNKLQKEIKKLKAEVNDQKSMISSLKSKFTKKKPSKITSSKFKIKETKKEQGVVKQQLNTAFQKHKEFYKHFKITKFAWGGMAAGVILVFIALLFLSTIVVFKAPEKAKEITVSMKCLKIPEIEPPPPPPEPPEEGEINDGSPAFHGYADDIDNTLTSAPHGKPKPMPSMLNIKVSNYALKMALPVVAGKRQSNRAKPKKQVSGLARGESNKYKSTIEDLSSIMEINSPDLNGKDTGVTLNQIRTGMQEQKDEFEQTKIDLEQTKYKLGDANERLQHQIAKVEERDQALNDLKNKLSCFVSAPAEKRGSKTARQKDADFSDGSDKDLAEMDGDQHVDVEDIILDSPSDIELPSMLNMKMSNSALSLPVAEKEISANLIDYADISGDSIDSDKDDLRKGEGAGRRDEIVVVDEESFLDESFDGGAGEGFFDADSTFGADEDFAGGEDFGEDKDDNFDGSGYSLSGKEDSKPASEILPLIGSLGKKSYDSKGERNTAVASDPQVLIEAKFVKVEQEDIEELGFEWWTEAPKPDGLPLRKLKKENKEISEVFTEKKRKALEKKLAKDPYNYKATEELKTIYQDMVKTDANRRKNDVYEKMSEVTWKWSEPVLPVPAQRAEFKITGSLKNQLTTLVLKEINVVDADIEAVLTFLAQESKRLDKNGKGINIALSLNEEQIAKTPLITMSLENIPMDEVIRYLCKICNLKYQVGDNIVTVGTEPRVQMEEKFFKVRSALISRIAPNRQDVEKTIRKYFTERGIPFPSGSQITYNKRSGKLTVTNTPENQRRLDTLLRALDIEQTTELKIAAFSLNKREFDFLGGSEKELKVYLRKQGIETPQGTWKGIYATQLKYDPKQKKLIIRNTPENIKKISRVLTKARLTLEELNDMKKGLPFIVTSQKPISTFSIDVDTASYTRCAKAIREGKRPTSDAVRPEEFINYFDYHYRSPASGMFGVYLEAAPSLYRPMNTTFRIGVQGKRLGSELKRPSVFTILIDTSGSMANKNRLDLVKISITLMLAQLRPEDKVAIIASGSETVTVVPITAVKNKKYIIAAINRIEPAGITDLEMGLITAYQAAEKHYTAGAYNRIVLFTDGISNISTASAKEILDQVESARMKGITNTIISVGGDGDDTFLESLADKGDGNYVFIEDETSAKDLFEEQFSARFREIARDVKIQVVFNPDFVNTYRQIGYHNRQLSTADFRNDTVDAGEVGSGQSVTALYEMKLNRDVIIPMTKKARSHIYPPPVVASVRIRYKRADTMEIEEFEYPLYFSDIRKKTTDIPPSFKLSAAVAEFAENLRYPDTPKIANLNQISKSLRPLTAGIYKQDKKVKELANLIRLAK